MNPFVYDVPTRVYFGENQLEHLGKELAKYGKRVLLCYGGGSIKKTGLYDNVIKEIEKAGLTVFELSGIEPNPRVTSANAGADICKKEKIDVILAVGGGSVLDCAKFISVASFYDGDSWDLYEKKVPVTQGLPLVTILTLSATGSEMNVNSVISNLDTKDKIGFAYPEMLPKASFLDPTNTYTVSKYQTACGSADILSHIFEVYFNMNQDLQMLDGIMESLMKTVIRFTPVAMEKPDDYEARANIMWASSWAINSFILGGKRQAWTCHPIEHELSAIYDITHGLGLAIVTPRWMEYTLSEKTVSKFYNFAVNVFDIDKNLPQMEAAKKGIKALSDFLFNTLGLDDTFTKIGIDSTNFKVMAEKAVKLGGLPHAFVPLNADDVVKIFEMCL